MHQKEYTIWLFKGVGKYDILISVSAKDLNEFNKLLTDLKNELSNVIRTYESLATLDWYKYTLMQDGITSTQQ